MIAVSKKLVLGVFVSFVSIANAAQPEFQSSIFSYEDPVNAKNLHVSLKGKVEEKNSEERYWRAEDIKLDHTLFHVDLFGNSTVMAGFADGQTRSAESVKTRVEDSVLKRFGAGHPHGLLTVLDQTETPFMHVVAGGGDRPGTSEIAYAIMPDYWRKGYGKSVVSAIVQEWAPEVYRIGRGTDLNPVTHANIIKAFQCFGGLPLDQLDATASPSNPGSWKILDNLDFKPAEIGLTSQEVIFDFQDKDFTSFKEMEDELLKLFESNKLESGKRYRMIDTQGRERTVSKHSRWERMKYHFEKKLS